MNQTIIANLSIAFQKVWPYNEANLNGIIGPSSQIMKEISIYQSIDIFKKEVQIDDGTFNFNFSNRETVSIWERLIAEFIQIFENIKLQPELEKSSKISIISQTMGIPRNFGSILYNAYEQETITLNPQGIIMINDVQTQGYISDVESKIQSKLQQKSSNEKIEDLIDSLSDDIGLSKGVIESIVFGLSAKMPPVNKITGQSYMRNFLSTPEWHRVFTKTSKVDIWGRQIVFGRHTLIKIEIQGMFQYVRLNPPLKSGKGFFDAVSSLSEELELQFSGKNDYYEPLDYVSALKFAVALMDMQEDLISILVDLRVALSNTKSILLDQ